MALQEKKLNMEILIMQCFGIIAVVLGHAEIGGTSIPNIINFIFPYYSWHMPFFVFLSGYLFDRQLGVGRYILKKIKKLLLPAMIVNAIYGFFVIVMQKCRLPVYVGGVEINIKSLFVTPFTSGAQYGINMALWFIFALFVIEVISCFFDRISGRRIDIIWLVVTLIISLLCCYKVFYFHQETRKEFINATLRLGFLMFFFWLGICYRSCFEKRVRKFLCLKSSFFIMLVIVLFRGISGYGFIFNTRDMSMRSITVPNGFWSAIVVPVFAILFFWGIAYSLSPYLEGNKYLILLGKNIRYVVYHHQFIFLLYSFGVGALMTQKVIPILPGFDFAKLMSNNYYSGGNTLMTLIVCIVAIAGPVVVADWFNKKKWYFKLLGYVVMIFSVVGYLYFAARGLRCI